MGVIWFPSLSSKTKSFSILQGLCNRNKLDVPKGYLAVYVGEIQKTRFVVPLTLSFLEHPLFKDLLRRSEEEFGFDHRMGGLTIHCQEDIFTDLISRLHVS
ncbi:putative small auxin-up RNA [Helianthus annuus]|nr:putative small auxin-up RNA [Helianthus annuus]KAJ0632677.1 putative small auxin-up RNA [Helianthus annuus]KAJ0826589.1 putative small auxin-up RNA [Helianthus annuus]KAJ0954130.1 putative small auxin-up RNA [Helianthus annuus]